MNKISLNLIILLCCFIGNSVLSQNEWLGNTSDWQTATNWSYTSVPDSLTDVKIPSNPSGGIMPIISSDINNACHDITIETSANVNVSSAYSLKVFGNITNNGISSFGEGTVIMKSDVVQTISGYCSFNNLKIISTVSLNDTVLIRGILTVITGELITNDKLGLVSNINTTALISGTSNGIITGKVNIERYISGINGYHYISAPVSDEIAYNLAKFGNGQPIWGQNYETYQYGLLSNIWKYDETNISQVQHPLGTMQNGWVSPSDSAETLTLTKGYSLNVASALTIRLSGHINTGSISMPLTKTASPKSSDDGWNLVGNPYPSPIDWKSPLGWTKSNIYDGIYFFNPSTQYTGTISSFINGISSDGLADRYIPVMQGFWVRAKANTTLKMTNAVRVEQTNVDFFKSGTRYKRAPESKLIRISASGDADGILKDYAVVYFSNDATEKFDDDYDAFKLINTDVSVPNLSFVNSENINFSINGLPDDFSNDITVPVTMNVSNSGYYRIATPLIQNIDLNIYIEDITTGSYIDMRKEAYHKFHCNPDSVSGRFFLIITNKTLTNITNIKNPEEIQFNISGQSITISASNIKGDAYASIYNCIGETALFETHKIQNGINCFNVNLKPGCYILKISGAENIYIKKFILL